MITNPDDFKLAQAAIANELAFSCDSNNEQVWLKAFIENVNYLILNNFNKLVLALYRLDISEAKLRELLKDQTKGDERSAADIICQLIIERQIQKIKTGREFYRRDQISEDERW